MKTQFPSQLNKLKELLDSFDKRELSTNQLDFTLHDEENHVPITHFFEDPERLKNEFICWGEKEGGNLILSWLVDGKIIDNAPIAMIDSEQSPVSVVAKNPEDFLSMLPYGTYYIGSIAAEMSSKWLEENKYTDEYFKKLITKLKNIAEQTGECAVMEYLEIVEMYKQNGYDLKEIERPIEEVRNQGLLEGIAYLELLQWYKDNGIEISKNPFKLIKEAVTLYPNFFDRAIELGLPFQKYE